MEMHNEAKGIVSSNLKEEKRLSDIAYELISSIKGENPKREGLLDTPKRFAKALSFLTTGYELTGKDVIGNALFDESDSEYVLIKDIEFHSLCEHHILPFYGKAHIAYIPNGKVVGLSKIPRLVDIFARRLQVQERLTFQIAKELEKYLNPKGVAVVVEADLMCMKMRGVQKQNSTTLTRTYLGEFKENYNLQREFFKSFQR